MQLLDWQATVQASIVSPPTEATTRILAWLRHAGDSAEKVSAAQRLDVYINGYVLRLTEALRTNYPAVHQLLGDDDFDRLALCYLQAHPPAQASIRWFGAQLAGFMSGEVPYSAVPAMAELAEFEWALRHTVDAADAVMLTPDYLHTLTPTAWANLRLDLHPSLSILSLHWNAPHIWRALNNSESPPAPVAQAGDWLVYRQPDLVSGWRSAAALEIAALRAIARGLSFADLCAALCELMADVDAAPMAAATFLRDWVAQGLVSLRVPVSL